jgi:hypothetical protein
MAHARALFRLQRPPAVAAAVALEVKILLVNALVVTALIARNVVARTAVVRALVVTDLVVTVLVVKDLVGAIGRHHRTSSYTVRIFAEM